MQDNEQKHGLSSEELHKLLDSYINEVESRSPEKHHDSSNGDYESTEPDTSNSGKTNESNGWSGHFGESLPIYDTNDNKLNINAHLSDSAPDEVLSFSFSDSVESVAEESNTVSEEKDDEGLTDGDDNEPKKPLPIRILLSVVSFFWNCGFLIKAVVYIAIVLIISAFLSFYVISISNDVFAFVKSDRTVTVNIEEDMTRKEVAYLLEKNGIIEYGWVFDMYLVISDDGDQAFLSGEHEINSQMNYSQILTALTTKIVDMKEVSITIPEGFTVDQIIDLFVANNIGTREGFIDAINNYPYQHEFVQMLEANGYPESRKYRLEGYLYPDTYYFYTESAEYLVINKLLNNFDEKFWSYYESTFKADIEKTGLSFDEIITLASMIQGEAKLYIDLEYISFVFHNRLSHPAAFPFLESDATIQYFLAEHVEDITQDQLNTRNPYNTYIYRGLPPGAICNPGFDALSAAIYPDAPLDADGNPMDAYFFVSNKAGKTYYSETLKGHTKNKLQVAKDNEEYENQ